MNENILREREREGEKGEGDSARKVAAAIFEREYGGWKIVDTNELVAAEENAEVNESGGARRKGGGKRPELSGGLHHL